MGGGIYYLGDGIGHDYMNHSTKLAIGDIGPVCLFILCCMSHFCPLLTFELTKSQCDPLLILITFTSDIL